MNQSLSLISLQFLAAAHKPGRSNKKEIADAIQWVLLALRVYRVGYPRLGVDRLCGNPATKVGTAAVSATALAVKKANFFIREALP
ncbi:hypothetical protein [Bradyrhizobium sp. CCGB20]|uniref:hypothetical protein n=1 Tax=Bradyrhizobium sp. CCGB20 TaxID=2949633 RepID=UPI0020B43C43|nr:hypothetical protein [Bradyrhizobium sp. CCGB20]MCP3397057.1 hypothetical protein [Bradyrhizobium sp. CCGB20]